MTVTGGNLTGNGAASGGGVHVAGGAVTLDATTVVSDNSATTGAGLSVAGGTLTATGTTIGGSAANANSASTHGGGAYVSGTGTLNLTSVTVSHNTGAVNGGGVSAFGGTATVTNSSILYNTSAYGGGVFTSSGTANVTGCTITNNSAIHFRRWRLCLGRHADGHRRHDPRQHGSTGTGGGAGTGGTGTLNLTATAIRNNTAANGAGPYSSAGTLRIRNSTISTNTATTTGGGVRVDGGTVTVGLTTVTENQAPEGAGLYANAGATTPTSSIIAKNKTAADTYGGDVKSVAGLTSGGGNVIGVGDLTAFTAQLDLRESPIRGSMRWRETARTISWAPARPSITACVRWRGTTYTTDQLGQPRPGGGGSFCDSGAYELQVLPVNCVVKSGSTRLTGTNARIVQQMVDEVAAGSTVKVAGNCTGVAGSDPWTLVINKSVTLEGGYSTADTETWSNPDPVENPTVLDAKSLGGVVHISTSNTDVTLRYLTITGGQRSNYAGVLVNQGARAIVEYCTIKDNHAASWGGGLSNYSGTLTATGNLIKDNTAYRAAGVFNNKGAAIVPVLLMRNNTVTGNEATATANVGGGGGIYNTNGEALLQFNTVIGNTAHFRGANIRLDGGKVTMAANIFADPLGASNCSNNGGTLTSGGFNQFTTATCLGTAPAGRPDAEYVVLELGALDYNGGPTQNYLPAGTATNPILDIIPVNACEEFLGTAPLDQRGRLRPSLGWETHENWCDPGSVERGKEILAVCGPPLDMEAESGPRGRCRYRYVEEAMRTAADGDIIVVSGVITENVTLDKDVTLRGPLPDWNTPGTHMGFVQAAPAHAHQHVHRRHASSPLRCGTERDHRRPEHPPWLRDGRRRHQQRRHSEPCPQHRL